MYAQLAAAAIPLTFGALAYLNTPDFLEQPDERSQALKFEEIALPAIGTTPSTIRQVHPQLENISGWISAVGASVALFDRDGDGLFNDYCLVDPRFDTVTEAPVPGTGDRFPAQEIHWSS